MNNKTTRHVLKGLQGNRPNMIIYDDMQIVTEEKAKKKIEEFRKAYPIIATHMDNLFKGHKRK